MSHFPFMDYVVRPVIQVGRKPAAVEKGCKEPRVLSKDDYQALAAAAPLTPPELAAILSGRLPFEVEPGDDLSMVQDWMRIRARIEEAVKRDELPATPTLSEGITWARKVGLPIIDVGFESVRAVKGSANHSPPARLRVSEHDPKLQTLAEEEARRLLEQGSKAPKKTVADNIRKSHKLRLSSASIARRIRNTWSRDDEAS